MQVAQAESNGQDKIGIELTKVKMWVTQNGYEFSRDSERNWRQTIDANHAIFDIDAGQRLASA
jgi:hypothetical protein